mgnify:CR=1 FL=1
MRKIRVLLIDDHAIVRMGLASLLNTRKDLEVIAEASDGESGIKKAVALHPDVVIIDLMMPGLDGVETTRRLLRQQSDARVLILTSYGSADGIAHALESGAKGAIMKSADLQELISAIKKVANGGISISSEIEQLISEDPPVPELSARQAEILHSVTRGLSNEDIAKQFGISLQMVKEHMMALFSKIGASNRAEAVAIALRKHLLKI